MSDLVHDTPPTATKRIAAIDVARGVALIAMAIYHFTWDLEFFGYVAPGLTSDGGWKVFARCIASSFLFLIGVSLVLAHARGIRWRGFWKRWLMVAASAALITVATYFATPDSFVFFGILHQIALASLIGLLFLRMPPALTLLVAAGVIALPYFYRADVFNHPALWWVGLSTERLRSNDYVPMFPWLAATLIGIGAARLAQSAGLFERLRTFRLSWLTSKLDFLGRHSLAFYLIHQPVLIGLVWLTSQIAPPPTIPVSARFIPACERSCGQSQGEEFCSLYCSCMLDELTANKMLDSVMSSNQTGEQKARLEEAIGMCTNQTEDMMAGEGAQ